MNYDSFMNYSIKRDQVDELMRSSSYVQFYPVFILMNGLWIIIGGGALWLRPDERDAWSTDIYGKKIVEGTVRVENIGLFLCANTVS